MLFAIISLLPHRAETTLENRLALPLIGLLTTTDSSQDTLKSLGKTLRTPDYRSGETANLRGNSAVSSPVRKALRSNGEVYSRGELSQRIINQVPLCVRAKRLSWRALPLA